MEHLADAVPDERLHDDKPVGVRVLLDRAPDVGDRRAGPHRFDAWSRHSDVDADELRGLRVEPADAEGGVGVAVHAADVDGDVEVHDVAVGQGTVVGDPVADHLVHRGAERLREVVVLSGLG